VRQPSYLTGFRTVAAVPLESWKSYFNWRIVESYASYLTPTPSRNASPSKARCCAACRKANRVAAGAALTDGALGDAVGKLYVEMFLPPETKPRVMAMFDNFVASFKDGIEQAGLDGSGNQEGSQAKLAALKPKIAYPDKWRDYSA
jgi:predicted metalloendopeptidase